jgi:hypothetical protein
MHCGRQMSATQHDVCAQRSDRLDCVPCVPADASARVCASPRQLATRLLCAAAGPYRQAPSAVGDRYAQRPLDWSASVAPRTRAGLGRLPRSTRARLVELGALTGSAQTSQSALPEAAIAQTVRHVMAMRQPPPSHGDRIAGHSVVKPHAQPVWATAERRPGLSDLGSLSSRGDGVPARPPARWLLKRFTRRRRAGRPGVG